MRTTRGLSLDRSYPTSSWPDARGSHDAPDGGAILRRLARRHVATLGAMAAVVVLIALLDRFATSAATGPLPLWLIVVAGVGSVAVGAGVRRMEAIRRPSAGPGTARGAPAAAPQPSPRAARRMGLASDPADAPPPLRIVADADGREALHETLADSVPASDPPSLGSLRAGPPVTRGAAEGAPR